MTQQVLFGEDLARRVQPFSAQLLKWIGNKQRFAHEIASYFPGDFGTYHEPFIGSGAVLATLNPERAFASDSFLPLVQLWQSVRDSPDEVKAWYSQRWLLIATEGKVAAYETAKASFNRSPNPADLLFISRACYGGVVRFRKADGYISTPCGVHDPIQPKKFADRVDIWKARINGTVFRHLDFADAMRDAKRGDLVYCDPPYVHSQTILYGAQEFSLSRLLEVIVECKRRGVYVALSIDGTKKTGDRICDIDVPHGLFEREVFVNVGRSMLRRFQMSGDTLEGEVVRDRLLLTY
jgi:DNA adenine methylase